MQILLINHYAGSPYHGMEYRPYFFGREWVKQGYSVNVVASSFSHLRINQPVVQESYKTELIDGITYVWLKSPSYNGNGLSRVLNIFSFIYLLIKYSNRLIKEKFPQIVIASSTYPLDIFPAYLIAKKTKAKLVYEVHDLWPLTLTEVGGFSKYHPFIVLLQVAENFAYKNADKVVSMLPKAIDHMTGKGLRAEKFEDVPNAVDLISWKKQNIPGLEHHANSINKVRENSQFIIGYFGTMGVSNALDNIIESAYLLKEYPVTFIFVGKGSEKPKLEQMVLEGELSNIIFLPPVPKSSIPSLLSCVDALIIGWKKSPMYRYGISPNKLLDYMMSGKPIIHAIQAANDPVFESGCGISVPPENPALIAEAIMQLYRLTPDKREEMGSRGRQFVIDHHDVSKLATYMVEKIQGK